jgi:hypothetical protein
MKYGQETIAEVLRPGEGNMPEELDYMRKIEEMKDAKRK